MSTNAIILIILAVVILVVLVLGFTMGWSKIAPWISTSNVDDIVNQCSVACSTGSTFNFCGKKLELKDDTLEDEDGVVEGTCDFFSRDARYSKFGVGTCSAIDCSDYKEPCEDLVYIDEDGKEYIGEKKNSKCNKDDGEENLTPYASDLNSNQYCCATIDSE